MIGEQRKKREGAEARRPLQPQNSKKAIPEIFIRIGRKRQKNKTKHVIPLNQVVVDAGRIFVCFSIRWNSFSPTNSRTIMFIRICHQSLHQHGGEQKIGNMSILGELSL